jgi:hypothetical protein
MKKILTLLVFLCFAAQAQQKDSYIFVLIYLTPESQFTDVGVRRTQGMSKESCNKIAKSFTMNQPDPDGNIPVAAACIQAKQPAKVAPKRPST